MAGRSAAYRVTASPARVRIRNMRIVTDVAEEAAGFDWSLMPENWSLPSTTLGKFLTWAPRTGGGVLCVVSEQGTFREGVVSSLEVFLNQNDSVTTWNTISVTSEGGWCAVSRVGGELYLSVTDKGIIGGRESSHKLYRSPTGDGGDWEYFATLNSIARPANSGAQSEDFNGSGCITVLPDGRWIMPGGRVRSYYGYSIQNYCIYTSDDNGSTWTERYMMEAYGFTMDYYLQGCPKHIARTADGTLYCALACNEGGAAIRIFRSTDNGTSWSVAAVRDARFLGNGIQYVDFELIGDHAGGLLLYCDEYSEEARDALVFDITDVSEDITGDDLIAAFPAFAETADETNPSMSIVNGSLIIAAGHGVICIPPLANRRIRKASIKASLDVLGRISL